MVFVDTVKFIVNIIHFYSDQTVLANPLSDQTIAPILVRNQPTVRVNAANSGASVGGKHT